MKSNALYDFLSAILAAGLIAGIFGVAYLLTAFIFGARKLQKLRDKNRVLWCLAWIGCGILGFAIVILLMMPIMLLTTGEVTGTAIEVIGSTLLCIIPVLGLILLWKWCLYLMEKEKKTSFWNSVIEDGKNIFNKEGLSADERKKRKAFDKKVSQPWNCPYCNQQNEGKTLFCKYCHTDRP